MQNERTAKSVPKPGPEGEESFATAGEGQARPQSDQAVEVGGQDSQQVVEGEGGKEKVRSVSFAEGGKIK